MKKKTGFFLMLMLMLSMMLSSCGERETHVSAPESVVVAENDESYFDSKDQAVVYKINKILKTVTFYNYDLAKSYTLSYDGITSFYDKYGTAVSVEQLREGAIADIEFLKLSKKLVTLKESNDTFRYEALTGFSINEEKKTFTYRDEVYKISGNTVLLADGIEYLSEVDPVDEVTICGKDTVIYSLTVDKPHGFLAFSGYEDLIGGTVEINEKQVERLSEGFKLSLPVGDYSVKVKKDLTEGERSFKINAGEVTTVDLSEIERVENRYGKVLFDPDPSDMTIYIDGNIIDPKLLQTLPYGVHRLEAKASGYESISRYFKVGEEKATLDVKLESLTDKDKDGADNEEDSSNTEGFFIYVRSPENVEVYFDGNYIGLSPVSVKKKAGTHTIMLKKVGFKDRTYTILVENTAKDDYYTFDVLEEKETGEKTSESDASTGDGD